MNNKCPTIIVSELDFKISSSTQTRVTHEWNAQALTRSKNYINAIDKTIFKCLRVVLKFDFIKKNKLNFQNDGVVICLGKPCALAKTVNSRSGFWYDEI